MPRAAIRAPSPTQLWPSVPRSALGGASALRQVLGSFDRAAALRRGQELLGCALELEIGVPTDRPAPRDGSAHAADGCLLRLVLERDAADLPLSVTIPAELAALLVDRVLGGDGATVHLPGDALDELSLGALAYLSARVLAAGGGGLRLDGLQAARDDAPPRAGAGAQLLWPLALTVDGRRWTLRACTPASVDVTPEALAPRWPPGLQLTLCAHAAVITLRRDQLQALQPGDALLPERCPIEHGADGDFVGEVVLHVEGARRTRWVCDASGSAMRVRHIEDEGGMAMTEGKRVEAAQRAGALAGDAPVEVCLELARFTLSLDELGRLAPGDALSTGRPIGREVVLRAGGIEVGAGELVQVNGEVGVRLTRVGGPQKLDAPGASGD